MAHISVMLEAVLDGLLSGDRPVARVIDGTLGAGGHTRALLERGVDEVLGCDLDLQALAIARENLSEFGERAHLHHGSYLTMREAARALGWQQVDGILLDLGLSSMQLDTPERGFAFRHEGPLDMRFDASSDRPPAADIVNTWDARALAEIFFKYGEEKNSRKLAQAIVQHRPYETTQQLAAVIEAASPRQKKGKRSIHPATQIFQALRIVVNDELASVERVLPMAIDMLAPGGRLAVISFHSLEDRLVKQAFADASLEIISPPGMASIEARDPIIKRITRKPLVADEQEIAENPRSRSAKLRVVEKL